MVQDFFFMRWQVLKICFLGSTVQFFGFYIELFGDSLMKTEQEYFIEFIFEQYHNQVVKRLSKTLNSIIEFYELIPNVFS